MHCGEQILENNSILIAYNNLWTINGTGWEWRDNDGLKVDGFNVVEPLVGTGFPEGVVTAPVGTPYTDLAVTNGAINWVKASGTGNTGWQVISGDTGWRTLSSWNAAGVVTGMPLGASFAPYVPNPGVIRIRRINERVSFLIQCLQAGPALNAGSAYALIAWPTMPGFTYVGADSPILMALSPTNIPAMRYYGGNVNLFLPSSIAAGGVVTGYQQMIGEWTTADQWPVTLP